VVLALAIPSESPHDARSSNKWGLYGRAAFILALLPLELLSLSLLCDLHPLQQNPLLVLRVASYGAATVRVLVIAVVALLVIDRRSIRTAMQRWDVLASGDSALPWKLAGHFLAAGIFAAVSTHVLRGNGARATAAEAWLWLGLGGLTVATWLAALAPVRFWAETCRAQNLPVVVLSLTIGATVFQLVNVADRQWVPLNDYTLSASERLLALVSNDVVFDPAARSLGTSRFQVEVAPACSGFEGIVLVTVALTLFLILFRNELRFPRALMILPLGIIIICVCNALRIVALILIGTYVSAGIAVGGFHSQAGWIGFSVVTLALAWMSLRVPFFTDATRSRSDRDLADNLSAAYLMPLMSVIAATMIAAAFSSGFDALYPLKILAGLGALGCFVSVYRKIPWSWSWLAALNGVTVFVLWIGLEWKVAGDGTQWVERLHQLPQAWMIAWLVFRAIGSATIVPLAEELAFRGYLMRRIATADFDTISYRDLTWLSVVASSVFFGLLHGRWFAGTLAGLCYALATRRRGMLCDAVTAHAVTNGLIAIYVLTTGAWQLWS
jgi:exosortase E/protease (VPEID-CTERM system)